MLVSWNWLKEYVLLDMPVAELVRRLMMAGLNHESTSEVGGDFAIDLEVTSNRPDCLGHLGIAREIAVLWDRAVKLPAAQPRESTVSISELASVSLECPELCRRYTARVIRGVKVGPSPAWLVRRLATIGIASINNVVDVTNYVLMECGQPLHAFDLARLPGRSIVVRDARPGEKFLAINHKTYDLAPGICVIADQEAAVGLGGVMGGAESEVSTDTVDVLIESADFSPRAIRAAARRLNLHSPSSYRFERGLDPEGVDWASRRCCELILQVAGGELVSGVIDLGQAPGERAEISLRYGQLKRILGIEIPTENVRRILAALGNTEAGSTEQQVTVRPPSWRRDLTREIDLIEEVARVHGYEAIPEDVRVPMAASARTPADRVLAKVRQVLTAAGHDEALTLSTVEEQWSTAFSPWADAPPLRSQMPVLRGATLLRRSLVPSLLGARRTNETLANSTIELFEIANVYLPQSRSLPREELMLSITSGGDYRMVKGVLEAVVAALDPAASIEVRETTQPLLDDQACAELWLNGEVLGYLGIVSAAGRGQFELRGPATVAEIKLASLMKIAVLAPQYVGASAFPAIVRDLNLEVPESVRWDSLSKVVKASGGESLSGLEYRDTYRGENVEAGKKRLLLTATLRNQDRTLTNEEADRIRDAIVAACQQQLGAILR